MVPQQAVVQTLNRASVWVVDKDNIATQRPVVLGEKFGPHWIIDNGISAGEMVITSGFQRLRSGAKVIAEVAKTNE
jgi:membrane fusion protein (multidrug efflux system)